MGNHGRRGKERGRGNNHGVNRMANKEIYRSVYKAPVDMEGQAMSVPIKLEMEIKEDENINQSELSNRVNRVMDSYREQFIAAARLSGIKTVSVDEMQLISEGRKCLLLFQFVCSNWQSSLIPFIHKFYTGVKKNHIPTHETPIISTQSLLLYPLRLLDPHFAPIARVQFGSLIDYGHLGIHWIMSGGELTELDKNDGLTFNKSIEAFFDYDKLLIDIQYWNRETNLEMVGEQYESQGKITIEMASIHRIFFDQNINDGNLKCSLVLLLDSPPKLKTKRTSEGGKHFPWESREELQRGRYPGEISDKKALFDSKAIILEFDQRIRERMGDKNFESLYFDMISRLRHRTGRMIEFSSFRCEEMLEGELRDVGGDGEIRLNKLPKKKSPYFMDINREDREKSLNFFDDRVEDYITNASEKLVIKDSKMTGVAREDQIRLKAFSLRSLLQGIIDRGMEYRIELLRYRRNWYNFVERVSTSYFRDEQRTLHALERVMAVISEERPTCTIPWLFQKEWTGNSLDDRMAVFSEHDKKNGYLKIMKLVATPTRIIFAGYEVSMGNRVLNKYAKDENHIIRLAFRDENGSLFRDWSYGPKIQKRVERILFDGITYAGRRYLWLGNSNSQLADQCCYMIDVDFVSSRISRQEIYNQLGKFGDLPNIPKMLARLGQLFTQSKPSEEAISPFDIEATFELIGGRNVSGKPYTFSDGVGGISKKYASILSNEHGLGETTSALQIRFRGEKGMLCVDPLIDKRASLWKRMGRGEETKVVVRPSMTKFQVAEDQSFHLEVVKFSSSYAVVLNRPFINILCQVSARQSAECHNRIKRRVMHLMHSMSREGMRSLYIEEKAIDAIKEMSFPFMLDVLAPSNVFQFTTEPFFRSLLLNNCKYIIRKQLTKMNIRVPSSKARQMFGVIDTTGILQHGQIFCQYSESIGKYSVNTRLSRGRIVLSGPIMITKNPCVSSGDVRMFDAIDIPALRHLVDVVVFPMHGPRPHPDEMAGSDLDGDEYMVIWDTQLFFERNEEASLFPSGLEEKKWAIPKNTNGEVDFVKCEKLKAKFFAEAIVNVQPGLMCSAHLAVSDLYGLDSKTAKSIEAKISVNLDYQKSGVLPEKMTTEEIPDPEDRSQIIPAERSELKPDFFRQYRKPGYKSRGICGEVFIEASKYEHALDCLDEQKREIGRDSSFAVPGWEEYKSSVEEELANYSDKMKSLLGRFGIKNEEELLSGMIINITKLFSDREEFNGTFFTTNRAIDGKVKQIVEMARAKFFEPFIDWETQLEDCSSKRNDVRQESILNRRIKSNTKNIAEIRAKTSAAYNIAYEAANLSSKRGEQCSIILSFPWIFYDVLMDIKMRSNSMRPIEEDKKAMNVFKNISKFIDQYTEEPSNSDRFANFIERFSNNCSIVAQSMKENEGLARASFVLIDWANSVEAVGRGFSEENLLFLFVIYGLGVTHIRGRKFIKLPTGELRDHKNKGEHLLLFLDYISSEVFRNRPLISFKVLGGGVLVRGEWRRLLEPALSCFLSLVTTLRLPLDRKSAVTAYLREGEPKVMQLPADVATDHLSKVRDALQRVSGCQDVRLRCTTSGSETRLVQVSAIGTIEQLRVLTSFIYPPAPSIEEATLADKIGSLPEFTFSRLMKSAEESGAAPINRFPEAQLLNNLLSDPQLLNNMMCSLLKKFNV